MSRVPYIPRVYFMRQIGGIGPIKIGFSGMPKLRLAQLMEWSPVPLEILLEIPGSLDLERNIMDCFADCHSHREWFFADPRLLDAISAMKAGMPVDQAIDLSKRVESVHGRKMRQSRALRGTSQETISL